MAINVYLVVIHKFTAPQLRKLEPLYVFGSYGTGIILASLTFLPEKPGKGPLIGDATLWCWITAKYDYLRIVTFYGPIWYDPFKLLYRQKAMFITFIRI